MNKIKTLLRSILTPILLGFFVFLLIPDMGDRFQNVIRPPLSPPGWVFMVVWPVLYGLMGVAAFLVKTDETAPRGEIRPAVKLYRWQLALNLLWSPVFFLWHWYGIAVIELLILLCVLVLTVLRFFRVRPAAGWLLMPYLLWSLFALYLTTGVWILNK